MTAAAPAAGDSWYLLAVSRAALPGCIAPPDQLAAAAGRHPRWDVDVVLAVSEAVTNAVLCGFCDVRPVKVAVSVQGGWIEAMICDWAAPIHTVAF
jgi:hypothetical protein